MSEDLALIIDKIKVETPDRHYGTALLLPECPGFRLNGSYREVLWKKCRIFVMYMSKNDVYRSAGLEFKDVHCVNIPHDAFEVTYLQTRLRGPITGLHFYSI
jgi:hypothetical protein